MSLKALAQRVIERDSQRDASRYTLNNSVPGGGEAVGHSVAAVRVCPAVIEATLRPTLPWPDLLAAVRPQNPEFPACPGCHHPRYWISPRGKVVCGKCGEVRFVLVAIQYHPVN